MTRTRTPVPAAALAGALALVALPRPALPQTLTLSDAVAAALDTHPTLAVASARVTAAEDAADGARSGRLPSLGMEASLTRFQEPMVVAPLHDFNPLAPPSFDESLVQSRLGVQYTLFDGGERGSRVRAGDAGTEAARFGLASVRMDVIERAVSSYLVALTAIAVLDAARAQTAALGAEQQRVQRNRDAGTAAEVEVLRATAALLDAHAERASAEARVGLALRTLAREIGLGPDDVTPATLVPVALRADGDESTQRAAHPSLEQARRSIAAAEARLAERRAGRFPRVEAQAGVVSYGTVGTDHTAEWQAGLRVAWPLFTGGARAAQIRGAEADIAAARGELASVELGVAEAIDAAETASAGADARVEALAAAVTQWAEVARIERLALDAGSGVQRDLLRAQAGLFQARAGHARAVHDAVLARVRMARALGTLDQAWIARAVEAAR